MRWLDSITSSMDLELSWEILEDREAVLCYCISWEIHGRYWRTGKPSVLQFMGHRVRHDLVTEQQ